jgi:hypothetical protein
MVLRAEAQFPLAVRLRREGAPIGEVFSFLSGLYFRGKLAYAAAFAAAPARLSPALVITAGRGLVPPETVVTIDDLRAIAAVPVDLRDAGYREPLLRDARILAEAAGPDCDIILLGSVATDKYVRPLAEVFGPRLLFPSDFAGRGDMSRGALMLRAARSGLELPYAQLKGTGPVY